jgi:hypothetical protein
LTTARRGGGNCAPIEPLAHAEAKSEVIIARIVAHRPGAVYSPRVLRPWYQPTRGVAQALVPKGVEAPEHGTIAGASDATAA